MSDEPQLKHSHGRRHLFLRPWWQLLWIVIFMSVFEVLTKYGATHAPPDTVFKRLGFAAVASPWVWLGTLISIAAFAAWLHVLRNVPLSLAFNISQGTYLLVPIGSFLFLGEHISVRLGVGTGLVLAGVLLLVPDLVKVEADEPPKVAGKEGAA
jgi:uncharacterized membrane protein